MLILTLPKPLHKEVLGAPIQSIDWSGHHLLVGTNQGTTKLFSVVFENDHVQDFSLIGKYVSLPSEVLPPTQLATLQRANTQTRLPSTRHRTLPIHTSNQPSFRPNTLQRTWTHPFIHQASF